MVLVGASGHGKSTLTNALVGAEVLTTRRIRDDGKGRHTSVRRELLVIPGGGAVIDTPGLRGVGLQRRRRLGRRRRSRTSRRSRVGAASATAATRPSRAVRSRPRSPPGRLPVRRWESWQRLQREAAWAETRTDARLRAEQAKTLARPHQADSRPSPLSRLARPRRPRSELDRPHPHPEGRGEERRVVLDVAQVGDDQLREARGPPTSSSGSPTVEVNTPTSVPT